MNKTFNCALGQDIASQKARIEHYLFDRLLPMWRSQGIDAKYGGFFERLNHELEPLPVDCKRLLVQCRQIFVFSHAYNTRRRTEDAEAARQGFNFLCQHFLDSKNGGWFFSVHDNGTIKDATKDAYGHAFVLFACAYYYRAFQDPQALTLAEETADILVTKLRDPSSGGFFEAAEADWTPKQAVRRQNPHMHLLEAFVALYQTDTGIRQTRYRELADTILELFSQYFFDNSSHTLGEFFNNDWQPHPVKGGIIEPGHHYEWYWLLMDYEISRDTPLLREQADKLYQWAELNGIDTLHGGIFNELNREGDVLDSDKRIWPVTECIKARAIRFELLKEKTDLHKLCGQLDYLFANYLLENGGWHEYLEADNTPKPYDLPGSTGYHLFLGLMEAHRVISNQQN